MQLLPIIRYGARRPRPLPGSVMHRDRHGVGRCAAVSCPPTFPLLQELSELTAIKTDDIINTLQTLGLIQYQKGQVGSGVGGAGQGLGVAGQDSNVLAAIADAGW